MRYHNITKDDMLNGDGLRVVLWSPDAVITARDVRIRLPGIQMAASRLMTRQRQKFLNSWTRTTFPASPSPAEIRCMRQTGRM